MSVGVESEDEGVACFGLIGLVAQGWFGAEFRRIIAYAGSETCLRHFHFQVHHRGGRLPAPLRKAFAVCFAALFLYGGTRFVMLDAERLLDREIQEVAANDLIAGAPLLHRRVRLTGVCVDHDSLVIGQIQGETSEGKKYKRPQLVALLRRAPDLAATGWVILLPSSSAKGCVAGPVDVVQGQITDETLQAAQQAGVQVDPGRVFLQGWGASLPMSAVRASLFLWWTVNLTVGIASFAILSDHQLRNPSNLAKKLGRIWNWSFALNVIATMILACGGCLQIMFS